MIGQVSIVELWMPMRLFTSLVISSTADDIAGVGGFFR